MFPSSQSELAALVLTSKGSCLSCDNIAEFPTTPPPSSSPLPESVIFEQEILSTFGERSSAP